MSDDGNRDTSPWETESFEHIASSGRSAYLTTPFYYFVVLVLWHVGIFTL